MSNIPTAGYGTIAGATTATPPTTTTTTSFVTPRPWREFLDFSALSRPFSYDDAMIRLRRNLSYFRYNYAAVTLLIVFLSLLWHPISMIVFLLVFVAWFYFYFSRHGPLVVFNQTLDDRTVLFVLAVITVVALVSTHVGLNILLSLIVAVVFVGLHGFRIETDIDLIDNSEVFDSVLVSETIGINVVLNEHDYSDEISIDNSFELNVDFVDDAYVNIDFETGILQSQNMIELEQNFDLTQFSENCECDCESGSCPICIEIDYVLQTDSKFITDAIDYEFDDQTQQLLVDRRLLILLIQQLARRRRKKSLDLSEKAVLGELLLKTSSSDLEVEDISLMVQNWQLPP
ncbi:hypothetical protein LR48_Vigan10g098600 [Vigna angularis]|uniref:PRA1 family protein n=1 Tax=Phaseolus angularis TaxID=3914 RepID=A0A0L9VK56_PHAAN|nr:hypothetical protein LR48_Vigan10g098600 [Vigna angularis]